MDKQNGITLIEILIAVAILGAVVSGITTLQVFSLKQSQSIYQRSSLIKALQAIELDLLKEMDSLDYRNDISYLSGLTFESIELKNSFDDAKAVKICFNAKGIRVKLDDASCEFNISYFKIKEEDRMYSSDKDLIDSSFKSVPISRLLYRVIFIDMGLNQTRVYYFSRLKTHVLQM